MHSGLPSWLSRRFGYAAPETALKRVVQEGKAAHVTEVIAQGPVFG